MTASPVSLPPATRRSVCSRSPRIEGARALAVAVLGCFVALTVGAATGCRSSAHEGSGGAGGVGAAMGGAPGRGPGGAAGTSPIGGGGEGGRAAAGAGGAAAGHGGGGSAGRNDASTTSTGGAGIGGLGGGAGGGAGAAAGQGGSQSGPCSETPLCTVGQTRCVRGGLETCQLDMNGCPFWGVTPGQPSSGISPDCPAKHVVCAPTGELICDCPVLTSPLCGPGGKGPLEEGDYCVTPGTATFATCHLVDGCYVETKELPCSAGTTCKQAAALELVPSGTACE